jgi:hypothetical protein
MMVTASAVGAQFGGSLPAVRGGLIPRHRARAAGFTESESFSGSVAYGGMGARRG